MLNFLLRNLAFAVLTLLVVSFLIFAINEYSPGDVAKKILGPYALENQVVELQKKLGLDRPLMVRYVEFLSDILSGDLGHSHRYNAPVIDIIGPRILNTLVLAGSAFAVIVPVGVILGTLAGVTQGSVFDRCIVVFGTIGTSIPEFAMGVFLVTIFVVGLGWLPGTSGLIQGSPWSDLSQMVLPVTVMVTFVVGYVIVMVRSSVVEVLQEPFVRTAILKGMKFRLVVIRHIVPNAMITPITVILLQINYLITGVVVVESLFAYPGFGRMMLEAAQYQDIALLEAGALVAVVVVVTTQILSDLAYVLLDPRINV